MIVAGKETVLLTCDQLAEKLGLTTRTIANRVRAGDIPQPVRIGRGIVRWNAKKIDQWLDAGCPRTEEAANAQR